MSYLYAKIRQRGNTDKHRKILYTPEQIYEPAKDLIKETIPYSQSSTPEDGCWYSIENFSATDYTIPLITMEISSVEFTSLEKEEIFRIDYLFSLSDDSDELCFQRIGKTALAERKRLLLTPLSGEYEYSSSSSSIVISENPDAVYKKSMDMLFFRSISAITGIFPNMINVFRTATDEETNQLLQMDFITTDGLTVEQVNQPNRKRILMSMETIKSMDKEDRARIYSYIADYCPDISNGKDSFVVKNNDDLKLVLYGIDQRFYTTPVGKERRIANSVIKL